jgi:hypothetical protein
MSSQSARVFVSYSHADAALVAPVVKLLRVNRSLVFQDIDRIEPGKRWRNEIADALAESSLVVVFWCDHASRSTEVASEWEAAIDQDKDVLPLLLDATPLPPALRQFQWIDFREVVGANHGSIGSPVGDLPVASRGSRASARPRRTVWATLIGVAAAAGVVLFSSNLALRSPVSTPPAGSPGLRRPSPEAPVQVEAPAPGDASWIPILVGVVVVAVGLYLIWRWRRRARSRERDETTLSRPEDIERRIATELEAAIVRRVTATKGHAT